MREPGAMKDPPSSRPKGCGRIFKAARKGFQSFRALMTVIILIMKVIQVCMKLVITWVYIILSMAAVVMIVVMRWQIHQSRIMVTIFMCVKKPIHALMILEMIPSITI